MSRRQVAHINHLIREYGPFTVRWWMRLRDMVESGELTEDKVRESYPREAPGFRWSP